ncbi:MAG: peptidylprolyl isomerase [Ferruginibacter sp.]
MTIFTKLSICYLIAAGSCQIAFAQNPMPPVPTPSGSGGSIPKKTPEPYGANPRISGASTPTQAANRKAISVVASIKIKIITDSGSIVVQLSDSTPLHRDNFVKLVKQGFYDSLLFHRVIPQFMIQGGDPSSKYAAPETGLGNGGANMTRIPAEFNPHLIHKKGMLAAARDGNPEKASSACQFYLVEGNVQTAEQLNLYEQRNGIKYTTEQRAAYTTIGGTPQLDMGYTVFGEVISGLEVIGKIANASRDGNNRPLGDVRMRMEIVQ